MTDTAPQQLNRMIQMVAELSRRERDGQELVAISEVAQHLGVSRAQVERDIRTLTMVGDDPEHDWLGSLSVIQEGDHIALSSRGHYQRPVRLTPDELLAIQAGLSDDEDGQALSSALAAMLDMPQGPSVSGVEVAGPDEARVVDMARAAAAESQCMEIVYAGGSRGGPERRVIEVHDVVAARGRFYLIAWCRARNAQRHFRADRVLEAKLLREVFERRGEFPLFDHPDQVFNAPAEVREQVRVRFTPAVARWVMEEFPDAREGRDGSAEVTYEVGEPAWLVRTVLGYGADAEVVEPPAYRRLLRSAVAEAT